MIGGAARLILAGMVILPKDKHTGRRGAVTWNAAQYRTHARVARRK